jgi:hypothetical protein
MNWPYRFAAWFLCKIGSHEWVCESIEPVPTGGITLQPGERVEMQLSSKTGQAVSFARMHCKRCGFRSKLTI